MRNKFVPDKQSVVSFSLMGPESGGLCVVDANDGRFIAATVYDPVQKEVIIGSKCYLNSDDGRLEATINDFGDFWFKDLPKSKFDLTIEAAGYERKEYKGLDTSKDINLGDIPLIKTQS